MASFANRYFRPRDAEVVLYRRLGVRRFKRYLPTGGDIYANRMGWHPILDRGGGLAAALSRFEKRTRLAETAHVLTFFFFTPVCVSNAVRGHLTAATLWALFNVGFNIYPIMVQRYNRHRVLRLQGRCQAAASTALLRSG